ncbi:MAG: PaaI family thioesterase [Caldisericia bacterium]|nr:PaaI family thioesterase [Caldisericia bacterium]
MTEYVGTETYCFACGRLNPDGLQLKFAVFDDHVEAFFECPEKYQGWDGIIHGGIVSTLIDEAMYHAMTDKPDALTAEMTVRFVRPLRVGAKVKVLGFVDETKGRIITTRAEIRDENNELIAKGTARYMLVSKINN